MDIVRKESPNDIYYTLVDNLFRVAPIIKYPKFYEEKEWRLIVSAVDFDNVKTRAKDSLILPYFDFKLEKNAIKQIFVGPNVNQRLALESVGVFTGTHQNHFKKVSVDISEIPYRTSIV